jgi:CheY-like chemotaxis protein
MFLNLEALRIALVNMGLAEYCQFVRNGQEVVEACLGEVDRLEYNEGLTQIVITDYEMPFITGVQAIAEIRAFYSIQNVRIRQVRNSIMDRKNGSVRLRELIMPTFIMFSVHKTRIF